MSKKTPSIASAFAAFALILQNFTISAAQNITSIIKVGETVTIDGRFLARKPRNLSLVLEHGGVSGLGERISDVRLTDAAGRPIPFRPITPGEYLGETDIASFSYRTNLTPLRVRSAAAHISWLGADGGVLMLDDLLPQGPEKTANIKIQLPNNWKSYSIERTLGINEFEVSKLDKSVIYVGRNWREKNIPAGRSQLKLIISGEWLYTDDEAAALATEVFSHYLKTFGTAPGPEFLLAVMRFPGGAATGNWEADTRGSSITLVSSDMPFKSQSLQRLHEQFRHEIFHLWIPNGVNLTGQYDWFYEGFALYESLKLGVASNRIRFDDFLDTLARAFDIDSISGNRQSLIDSSKQRWSGANTQVYARGMLIAFLSDLALLDKSKGKRSSSTLVRSVYDQHRPPATSRDGNAALAEIFNGLQELKPIADRYISGSEKIDWAAYLNMAGLEATTADHVTRLAVMSRLSGRQKDLLDKLGYNNWRRLAR